MIIETTISYISIFACLAASIYLFHSGARLSGSLLLVGFLLHAQGVIFMQFIGHPEGMGECWATVQDYYACLPLNAKLSMHLSQLGPYFLAIGIFVAAKTKSNLANGT
jgi:hypothetical protein